MNRRTPLEIWDAFIDSGLPFDKFGEFAGMIYAVDTDREILEMFEEIEKEEVKNEASSSKFCFHA